MDLNDEELQEYMDSLDVQTRSLIAEVDLGRQAKEFFQSDLGRYILGCAQQEAQSALIELSTVSWWRFIKVRELQNRMWRARMLIAWMADLVRSGKSAEQALAEAGQ